MVGGTVGASVGGASVGAGAEHERGGSVKSSHVGSLG